METTLENCLGLRLVVKDISPLQITRLARGLICIGVGLKFGLPPLVAICDADDAVEGVGSREAAGSVVSFLEHQWRLRLPVRRSNLVVLDSRGKWQHASATGGSGSQAEMLGATRWPGCGEGSEESFLGVFGAQGQRVLGVLEEIVGGDRMSFGDVPKLSSGSAGPGVR